MNYLNFKPFRWSVEKRNEIGSLIDFVPLEYPSVYLLELFKSSARILAFAGNADLYFVGRSPENYFDFLSGIFHGTAAPDNKVNLFQFSGRDYTWHHLAHEKKEELGHLLSYMKSIGLEPRQIVQRKTKTTFVDVVYGGLTFKVLIEILYNWALKEKVNWKDLQKKLRIVGITIRTKNSPNTWRWQQQVKWIDLIGRTNVKNVSVPGDYWSYIANYQSKTTDSHYPGRWSDPKMEKPSRSKYHIEGLRIAATMFDMGLNPGIRMELHKYLTNQHEMRFAWFRKYLKWLK